MEKLEAPSVFFFFQAEDGIRDLYVTGVQTCALPIYAADGDAEEGDEAARADPHRLPRRRHRRHRHRHVHADVHADLANWLKAALGSRSEERRVGKECRSRGGAWDEQNR